jgi:hypothetical protein
MGWLHGLGGHSRGTAGVKPGGPALLESVWGDWRLSASHIIPCAAPGQSHMVPGWWMHLKELRSWQCQLTMTGYTAAPRVHRVEERRLLA